MRGRSVLMARTRLGQVDVMRCRSVLMARTRLGRVDVMRCRASLWRVHAESRSLYRLQLVTGDGLQLTTCWAIFPVNRPWYSFAPLKADKHLWKVVPPV